MANTTTTHKNLKSKIFEFQKLWIVVKRNSSAEVQMRTWGKFSYKYSSFDEIWENIAPKLNELNLLITHSVQNFWGDLFLETTLTDVDTDEILQSMIPIPESQTPQTLGSAITYFKRYNTCALLNIIVEWDDDDWASAEKSAKNKNQTPQAKKQFLDENFENFKKWTQGKTLEQIALQKDEILAKYTVSEPMCQKLDDFLSTL